MKLGITAPVNLGPIEDGAYAADFARLVEELGFESIWLPEHVVMCPDTRSVYPYHPSGRSPLPPETPLPDPLVWLAYAAAATERVRLGTGVLVLPQRNPVVLAKAAASLDRLSGGRLLLGIGVGWVREESEALGAPFEDRGPRTDEFVAAMRALWREPVASFQGEHVRFDRVVCEPRPAQPGGVPIVVGGHSLAAARRAGRLGDGFYPLRLDPERFPVLREAMEKSAREAGRDPSTIELTTSAPPRPEAIEPLARLGVHRVVVHPPTADLAELERWGRSLP